MSSITSPAQTTRRSTGSVDASDSEQRVTFAFTLTAPAPLRHDDVAALRHVLDHLRVD